MSPNEMLSATLNLHFRFNLFREKNAKKNTEGKLLIMIY